MKLRLVKFLTSRENEIEKKEEGEGALPSCVLPPPGCGLGQSPAPFSLSSSLHLSILSSPTILRQQVPSPPPQLVGRHVPPSSCSSHPSPAVPLLPFFFIKLPKQQSGRPLRSVVPSLPVQLADCGPPSSPHPCPFTKSGGRDSSPVLMASSLWRVEPQENKDRK